MADVIRLQDHAARASRRSATPAQAGQDAVVLMFTGIRYERIEDQKPQRDMPQPLNSGTH
ncbi:hypothetical protein [Xaviernesmea oryzae]|uniref:hypothetical protein n=1 Tax=Xaviernesmea oryzae TaxID=464029 RepID=UPI0008BC419E|nr:hypothetical protein [Xaviernesmea oryzae]SEL27859.1 hypothetical protein SAMN04487976_10713 [Xaviernesmea oryzae]